MTTENVRTSTKMIGCSNCDMTFKWYADFCSHDCEPLKKVKIGIMDWQECDWNVGSGILCSTLIKDETSEFCEFHAKEAGK